MNRRNTKKPPHASALRAVIERLETRAMLAGLGQDSLGGLGSITAVLLPGVSSPPGIVFNGGSPTLGSTAGTGGSQSNGPVLFSGTGSGTGSSTSGSGSSTPNGPVLFGGTGSGSGSSISTTGGSPDPNSPVLLSQYTGGSNAGTQGSGTDNGGTLSGSDLWLLYSAGLGAGSSSSGASGGSSSNLLTLLSQYQEGSNVGRQGNGTVGTLTNAELWRLYWSGAGAGSSSASTDEGSLADYATISAQYTGGSGIGGITPSVYNPESDGPPVFHSGVFTGDHGSVQFVQTADTGNQGTGEGDASESDDKSRARSWWGIRGWFLGDGPIDDGESQIVQTADAGSGRDGGTRTGSWFDLSNYGHAGDWLDQDFGGGTYGDPSTFGLAWGWARGLFAVAPIAGEISDGAELISGVGPNGEKLTPGQRGATAVGTMIPFVPAGVARKGLRPLTDKIDDAIEFMSDAGRKAPSPSSSPSVSLTPDPTGTNSGPYRGGSHAEMSGPQTRGDGLDSHHMPDRNADPSVHPDDGPAIQMDPPDHHATSSNGRNGAEAARYRAESAELIREGRYREAMAREIRDARRAAEEASKDPTKYNEAIQEMLEYARRVGQLPPRN